MSTTPSTKVRVTHQNFASDETKVAPKREPVPPGTYVAMIMAAPLGVTRGTPVLQKLSVEFQIMHSAENAADQAQQGRRVFQDYILEHDAANVDLSRQRAYELRMLLEGAGVPFDDEGFDPSQLVAKVVKITVRHRLGRPDPQNPTAAVPVFSNVTKVDTNETINEADLI